MSWVNVRGCYVNGRVVKFFALDVEIIPTRPVPKKV